MAISSEILFFHTFFAKRSEMINHIRHRYNRTIKTPIERVRTDKQVEKRKMSRKRHLWMDSSCRGTQISALSFLTLKINETRQ